VKFLLDSCVWGGTKTELQLLGHDVVWCGDWESDPGDELVLEAAHRENRILVTLDKDFGELAVIRQKPHSGILRLVGFRARQQAAACAAVISAHGQELLQGAIATASPTQVRLRPASPASNM
jgi:predicted nuclease of predicted toxin-antitoxin system